jgi:hypothetical protein
VTLNIVKGKTRGPRRIVITGAPGCGKSTWACGASPPHFVPREDVLVLGWEDGIEHIGAPREDARKSAPTWEAALKLIAEAATSPGPWDTLVVDTIDKVQDLLVTSVLNASKGKDGKPCTSLEEVGGGYGKGANMVGGRWRELIWELDKAKAKGRTVILVSHIKRQRVNDPALGEYHEWQGGIVKDAWAETFRWADDVLYACYEQAPKDGRIYMSGNRLLKTVKGNGYDAKNRLGLPEELPLSWAEYARYLRDPAAIRAAILDYATDELRDKAKERCDAAGDDVSRLCAIETALIKKQKETGNGETIGK